MQFIPSKVDETSLKLATKLMALETIKLVEGLPKTRTADVLGRQLLRSATSVAANYRSACRAKSRADMSSKLAIVEEEADESCLWLELLMDSGAMKSEIGTLLAREYDRITAIAVASRKTLYRNSKTENPKPKS